MTADARDWIEEQLAAAPSLEDSTARRIAAALYVEVVRDE